MVNSSDGPRPRRVWLWIATVSLLLGLAASGFSPPVLFELMGRDHELWVERFAAGDDDVRAQVEAEEGRVPHILPGPADAWARGKPHGVTVRFGGPRQDYLLALKVSGFHAERPPLLTVTVNGHEVGRVQLKRGKGLAARPARVESPLEYPLAIPAARLDDSARHALSITNEAGSWVTLSALTLRSAAPTFAFRHYLDRSPPSRGPLVALGVGLLALWIAGRRRDRKEVSAVLILGAGLGLLTFLALGSETSGNSSRATVTSGTSRVVWLLLVLGVAVNLTPRLPRLAVPRLLDLTALVTGCVVMVLELVGFRLLSPFFGYSIHVWGALLGVVMGALAVGYYLGGWLADHHPSPTVLYRSLAGTAVLILASLYAYPFIVRFTVNLPLVAGSLLTALLLTFLPMTGLGLVPPFLVRFLAGSAGVGSTAGRIYALTTVGSLVGTLASAFVLLTTLGPWGSWVSGGLVLLLLACYGLSQHGARWALGAAPVLGFLIVFTHPWVPEASVASFKGGIRLYATESEYSHLEVIEIGKTLQLVPQLRFTHTIYNEERVFEPIISYGLLPSFLTSPRTLLHLGMGGGTLARAYLHAYPEIRIDAVDIDPEMVRLARRFFGLREDPRLRIFIEDARAFLLRPPPARYDLVIVDLWQGGVFIPYYTVTREFFELARDRLSEGGVLAIVIGKPRFDSVRRRERYDRLFRAVGNTLAAVLPSVFFYPVSDIAYFFVATSGPTSLQSVRTRLEAAGIPEVRESLRAALRGLGEYRADPQVPLLTDDLAPVDQLIYDAFFRE